MIRPFFLVLTLAAATLAPDPVSSRADRVCPLGSTQRAGMVSFLENRYSEHLVAFGLTHNGVMIEVTTTGDGNTWTILKTSPEGCSVMAHSGTDWLNIKIAKGDPI